MHLEENGIAAHGIDTSDMDAKKRQLGISPAHQSCHTGIKDGYIFEGHVPARYIRQFLANVPDGAIGLAVPEMPRGSPGMEMGNQFDPYDVVLLRRNGSSAVFASVQTPAMQ